MPEVSSQANFYIDKVVSCICCLLSYFIGLTIRRKWRDICTHPDVRVTFWSSFGISKMKEIGCQTKMKEEIRPKQKK